MTKGRSTAIGVTRRQCLTALGGAALLPAGLAAVPAKAATDISGAMPDLEFTMTRATDGETVTGADYRGKIVLVYFGFTNCPDICPLTLSNLTRALEGMGEDAEAVRILFVTVDPERDSLEVMKAYQDAFAPQVVGLRGTENQMTALAKRYRVAHSVRSGEGDEPPTVSHGSAVYAFDREGRVQKLFTGLSDNSADVDALRADLQTMVSGGSGGGWLFGLL